MKILNLWRRLFTAASQLPEETKMSTLRETIQAKIAAAEAELAQSKAELVSLETTSADWLNKEVQAVKDFFTIVSKHL